MMQLMLMLFSNTVHISLSYLFIIFARFYLLWFFACLCAVSCVHIKHFLLFQAKWQLFMWHVCSHLVHCCWCCCSCFCLLLVVTFATAVQAKALCCLASRCHAVCVHWAIYITYWLHVALVSAVKVMRCIHCSLVCCCCCCFHYYDVWTVCVWFQC